MSTDAEPLTASGARIAPICIARIACIRRVNDPIAPANAPMQPGCCPDAPQAKEEEEVGAAASPGSLEALAPH